VVRFTLTICPCSLEVNLVFEKYDIIYLLYLPDIVSVVQEFLHWQEAGNLQELSPEQCVGCLLRLGIVPNPHGYLSKES